MTRSITFTAILLAFVYGGCEPIEDRVEMSGAISAEELNLSATPLVVEGKNSNKVVLDNKSPVLSSWNFGVGISRKKTDTVLLVVEGENEIIFTGLNPDGSEISKTLTVNVDEIVFDVPPEWGFLTEGSQKEWVWDLSQPAVWGNGGYMGDSAPAWWAVPIGDIDGQAPGEGRDAKMVFSLNGATLTKVKADGETETGTFSFDMTQQIVLDDGTVWARGKLTTSGVSVLCGISPNEGGAAVYEYDILALDNERMVLSYPEPGAGPWGTAWFWMFSAAD